MTRHTKAERNTQIKNMLANKLGPTPAAKKTQLHESFWNNNLGLLLSLYLRYKFLPLHTVNVSRHIKGSNDVENIISGREFNNSY